MKSLLIATTNKAKRIDLLAGLKHLTDKGIQILTLNDLNITEEPEETGITFEENAKLKAEFYANLTNLPTVADDGGLMIDILNGEPGVHSRRWVGYPGTDEELIAYALKRLEGIPPEKRTAHFTTCLYFYMKTDKEPITCVVEEGVSGKVADKPSGNPTDGYPYRALFIVEKYHKYYDELSPEEHVDINHRQKAIRRLAAQIEKYLIE